MKPPACLHLLAFAVSFAAAARADVPWLPSAVPPKPATGPALTQGNFLKPEVGQAVLDAALKQFPDRASWDTYAAHLRTRLQEGANLVPWPRRTRTFWQQRGLGAWRDLRPLPRPVSLRPFNDGNVWSRSAVRADRAAPSLHAPVP